MDHEGLDTTINQLVLVLASRRDNITLLQLVEKGLKCICGPVVVLGALEVKAYSILDYLQPLAQHLANLNVKGERQVACTLARRDLKLIRWLSAITERDELDKLEPYALDRWNTQYGHV